MFYLDEKQNILYFTARFGQQLLSRSKKKAAKAF
jgi:hypothetical protein